MKYFVILIALLVVVTKSDAQHTASPVIPDRTLNITAFGADGTGKLSATGAIQQALDQLHSLGGGKVIVPKGIYLCGPLKLYSHINLQLDAGATLRLNDEISSYVLEDGHYGNFIEAKDATDIKISGTGTLDGQGAVWWKQFDAKQLQHRRPQMVYLVNPTRLEISGITFLNPPNTHLSIKDGTDVYIHHIRIEAPENSHNTDGINISVRNCTIDQSTFSTGDDDIALNFGSRKDATGLPACTQILIRNCTFLSGHGLSIGSYTAGNLIGLQVSNCSFDGTTSALRIKSARGRGGVVENVSYSDISIKNSKSPIYISAYYPKEPASPELDTAAAVNSTTPTYRNITFKNVRITGADYALRLWGLPESPLQNISFENVEISAKKAGIIANAKDLSFIKCKIVTLDKSVVQPYNVVVNYK